MTNPDGKHLSSYSFQIHGYGETGVYGCASMRNWAEGALAIGVVIALGAALFLFTGEPLGAGATNTTEPISFDPAAAARGQVTAETTGCLQCHTADGTPSTGPTWKGLAGSNRPLASGESVTADEAYLRNAIIDPASQVVKGYDAIMPPDYGEALTDQELEDLVAYISSLES